MVQNLVRGGYLNHTSLGNSDAFLQKSKDGGVSDAPQLKQLQGSTSSVTPKVQHATDQFEGKRSLATTRMFLFDLGERMFTRRDPVLAEQFRENLRNAKDRQSMLTAGREMLAEIERIAGYERADAISERIAMLLPEEDLSAT